jgi:hypothetical protein
MVLSSITGTGTAVAATTETPKLDQQNVVEEISQKEVEMMMSTEQYVRKYFSDIPIMIQIAKCESTFRQLDDNGDVHRGKVDSEDVGVMQINEHYQLQTAEKENYNIYTLEGNTAYARELYEKEGTTPWDSSKACWGKYENQDLAMNAKTN